MGIIFIVFANILWGLELILIRKFFPHHNSFVLSAATCVFAAIMYLPAFVFSKQRFTTTEWIIIAILGGTSWFLAQLFYVVGIQKSPSSYLATLATLSMPISAGILGFLFLKEQISLQIVIGAVLMVSGFLIASF